MKCEYCNNNFCNKTSLNSHQKTAKYCLLLQNNNVSDYVCICAKNFNRKFQLHRHQDNCLKYQTNLIEHKYLEKIQIKDDIIQKLEERIRVLEEDMKDIAVSAVSRPTTVTTNTNNNHNNILMNLTPFDINKENFTEKINEHFNKNYLVNGQKGVAQFVVEKILKDDEGKLMYICTDPSRQIYRFKSVDGFIERDVKAKKLTTALYDELRSKSHRISDTEIKDSDPDIFVLYSGRFQDIKDLDDDNSEFRVELANLTSR